MTAPTNGSGGGVTQADRDFADMLAKEGPRIFRGIYRAELANLLSLHRLATPPAQVGAATDSGEAVWTPWTAQDCERLPMPQIDTREEVFVMRRNGRVNGPYRAGTINWFHNAVQSDILFYRPALASPTKPVADSVEAVAERLQAGLAHAVLCKKPSDPDLPENWRMAVDDNRELADMALNALPMLLASLPSTDQEGLVGTTSADTILYSIKHHFAVMGDTREGIECALADARSLVANLEARARQTGSEGA